MLTYCKKFCKRSFSWLFDLRGTPEAIAGGFALGILIAFTPTVGVQMIIAAFIATLFNLNRIAAIVPLWISNPVTLVPIYAGTYWIGLKFVPGPSYLEVFEKLKAAASGLENISTFSFIEQFQSILSLGGTVFGIMTLGALIIGLPLSVLSYYAVLFLVRKESSDITSN